MKKIINWIKQYQVVSFYILTFAISWGLAFFYDAFMNRGQSFLLPLAFIAICGPGLAGIIISAIINEMPKQGKQKRFWIVFSGVWIASTIILLGNLVIFEKLSLYVELVCIFGASVGPVAFIFASANSRNPTVRHYLVSLVRLRDTFGWTLAALVLFPALFLLSIPVSEIFGKDPIGSYIYPEINLSLIGLVVLKFIYQFFFFNATGEETGWRGFVLPRLQARSNPLLAALFIGFFWASWHFPFWWSDGNAVFSIGFWIDMWAVHILASILIAWICNRAKGSILVAGAAHAAMNTVQVFAPFGTLLVPVLALAALAVILNDRMWKRLPTNHPAVYDNTYAFDVKKSKLNETLEVSNV